MNKRHNENEANKKLRKYNKNITNIKNNNQ